MKANSERNVVDCHKPRGLVLPSGHGDNDTNDPIDDTVRTAPLLATNPKICEVWRSMIPIVLLELVVTFGKAYPGEELTAAEVGQGCS